MINLFLVFLAWCHYVPLFLLAVQTQAFVRSNAYTTFYRPTITTKESSSIIPLSFRVPRFWASSRSKNTSKITNKDIKTAPLSSLVRNIPNLTLAATKEDIIPLEESQRLICLGDVHGDLQGLKSFLEIAGVCDTENETWIGNNTILVQCGDVLDRGYQELACFELLAKLSKQAPKHGGKVILLYGNHEAMNAMGLFQYAMTDLEYEHVVGRQIDQALETPKWRMQYVGNQPARWATYEPNGLLAQTFMANMKVAVQVGKTVCVHAGLTAEHLQEFGGIDRMNQKANEWITQTNPANVTFNNKGEYPRPQQAWVEAEARQTSYINTIPPFLGGGIGATAPVWMRDYSSPNDSPPTNPKAQIMIDAALQELGCDRMVMGHTVQRKINAALNGKAWRVDVGVSRGVMGGTPEVLEIQLVNNTEVISILTKEGKVPASERQILALANFF